MINRLYFIEKQYSNHTWARVFGLGGGGGKFFTGEGGPAMFSEEPKKVLTQ